MKIQVVVTYSPGILGKLMRWWGLTWSHAAIRYHEEWIPDGVWRVWETGAWGTVNRGWDEFMRSVTEHKIFEMKEPLGHVQKQKILSFCEGSEGKPYNFLKLLWIALEYLIGKRKPEALAVRAYVCSSFVAAAFQHVMIDLVPRWEDIWVVPDDLAKSPLLKEVEG